MVHLRSRLKSVEIVVIIVFAVLAALVMFVRPPETILFSSVDGVVTVTGEVPRSAGEFRLVRDDDARGRFAPDATVPVYRLEPVDVFLPQSVTLSFSVAGLEGVAREAIALARWNQEEDRWELAASLYDPSTDTINAPIRALGWWTLRER